MPTSVTHTSGGLNTSPVVIGAIGDSGGATRDASHRGDSGTNASANKPNGSAAAPTSIAQRQRSGVIGSALASVANRKMPTFADVPMIPASAGRDTFDHASDTSATPLGHIPPTPRHARNHSPTKCSGASAKYTVAENVEYVMMLSAIARERPMRSPRVPNSSPPAAAPN